MVKQKYLAILKAKIIEGLYLPFSKEPIVCRDTSKIEANSSCVIPFALLISSSLFFTFNHLPHNDKLPLHIVYSFSQNCQVHFPFFSKVETLYFCSVLVPLNFPVAALYMF